VKQAKRVLVITGDPIGAKLAGPAIRAWAIADSLASAHDVRLVSLVSAEKDSLNFSVLSIVPDRHGDYAAHEEWCDVIVLQGYVMSALPVIAQSKKIIVVDIYDPMHLEQLEQARELSPELWLSRVSDATAVLNEQLRRGDFFLCASERQRTFWLGQLAGQGRLNPLTYRDDPDFEGLIAVVPFGLSDVPPAHERQVLKGTVPGIGATDKVLLWSGGLYNWFDPLTLVRAVASLIQRRENVRLYFQGTAHPHPGVPEMAIVGQTRSLAAELNVLNSAVFLNDSWVDFTDRQNYLLEADAGVSTHHSHIETTFSFRTRILDYLWAGLPMVVTKGDYFAELIEREELGLTVPADDSAALAEALERVLFDKAFVAAASDNISRVRSTFYWKDVLVPLNDFVRHAQHAPDIAAIFDGTHAATDFVRKAPKISRTRRDLGLARDRFAQDGVVGVLSGLSDRLSKKFLGRSKTTDPPQSKS
jgi:glycosyltransferase involved in cell wall biosynthesis